VGAWGPVDPEKWGAASRRRRLARDYDLVVLAPVGETGGYFVNTATALPQAMTFVMHNVNGAWLVANHIGSAYRAQAGRQHGGLPMTRQWKH